MRLFKVFQSVPEVLTYGLLVLLLVLNIIGLSVSASNAHQAKILAAQNKSAAANNQKQTLVARQQNTERQEALQAYVECILLIGKTNPTFNFETATLPQAKTVLDQCATQTSR